MPIPQGRDLVVWLMMMTFALLAIAAGVTGSDVLLRVAVIVIGLGGILVAFSGKPERVWGLTERLLQLLPEPVWRAVIGAMGVGILALGVMGLIFD